MSLKPSRTYGSACKLKDAWVINEIEPHVATKLKKLFPKIPTYAIPPYRFPDTIETCSDLEWFFSRYPMCISDSDFRKLMKGKRLFDKTVAEMESILSMPNYHSGKHTERLKPGMALRSYQEKAIAVFRQFKVLLCGDDLGLGKTYLGIGAVMGSEQLPAAIVVQTHLPYQWAEKISEFSHLRVHVIRSTKLYDLPEADIYIFKYSLLSSWTNVFTRRYFKSAVFDEIQELRTGTVSDKGSAAKILCDHVEYRLGLSATPIYNYADEIFNIFNILQEGILGTRHEFLREWSSSSVENGKLIIENPKALGSYLRERFLFIRRTKQEVGQELAPINRIVHTVGYDEKSVKAVENIARQLAITATSGSFVERGKAARELDMLMRHSTGISKAKYVAEFAKIFLENNEPIILAGWHRDVYSIWIDLLQEYNPLLYTGSESPKQKEENKKAFIDGKSNLFILSLRSGAGLDGLQGRCSTVLHGELDWSPQVHTQITGRVYREGQKNKVMSIFLVSEYGSDPLIVDMLGVKASQATSITDPLAGIESIDNDESRLIALAHRILDKKREPTTDIYAQSINQTFSDEGRGQLALF